MYQVKYSETNYPDVISITLDLHKLKLKQNVIFTALSLSDEMLEFARSSKFKSHCDKCTCSLYYSNGCLRVSGLITKSRERILNSDYTWKLLHKDDEDSIVTFDHIINYANIGALNERMFGQVVTYNEINLSEIIQIHLSLSKDRCILQYKYKANNSVYLIKRMALLDEHNIDYTVSNLKLRQLIF